MTAANINAIRTYTVPPEWLLDIAFQYGLCVLVGIAWEQHVTFLDDRKLPRSIIRRVESAVTACDRHPAILGYSIGNEIPAPIVRWHGARQIEQFLRELCWRAKSQDPNALLTYVNYPTTEYLELPFLDFVCFNVYLHSEQRFGDYLARLLNLSGERPLVLGELGLDSRHNGEGAQAHLLGKQIHTALEAGCAGLFVFSWTDEWHRGGCEIEDWDFGLTRRDRSLKPALAAVAGAFAPDSENSGRRWPRISVVICTRNGQRYLPETLSALEGIDYPNYEVIVVDDGSTDQTAVVASNYNVRLIRTENRGLSSARNTGARAATGEIVAYIDDDAYPDREWLKRLAHVFLTTNYVGVGGPNIPPPGDSLVAQCVAHAPGGPIHVLISDHEAEHIPGCNMAFRRGPLLSIGGFDPQFRVAGDDVDVCWRVQEQGWKLGFSPTASVFHHRRDTLRAYWKQQTGYGKAEALLERKWPDKYNAAGHLTWLGRIYNARGSTPLWWWRRGRIYQGTWGSAAYQRLYQPAADWLGDAALLPEWYLVIALLSMLSAIGFLWKPLLATVPLLILAVGASIIQAALSAGVASSCRWHGDHNRDWKPLGILTLLHLLHPLARLCGRLKYGLHPWRRRGAPRALPRRRTIPIWSEHWQSPEDWLCSVQAQVRTEGATGFAGGAYDDWDLEIQGGLFGGVRLRMAAEEHGQGRQMLRFRVWPRCAISGLIGTSIITALTAAAALDHAWAAAGVLAAMSLIAGGRIFHECSLAMYKLVRALRSFETRSRISQSSAARSVAAAAVEQTQ
jgi:glycosyltransferase involved in cell wall biosynthesis